MPVIPTVQEADIERIWPRGQPRRIDVDTPSQQAEPDGHTHGPSYI
jgi:hypothetical protein